MIVVDIFDDGSSARALLGRMVAMRAAGVDNRILFGTGPEVRGLRDAGVPVRRIHLSRNPSPPRALVALVEIASYLIRHRVQVVHTHGHASGTIGGLAARLAAVPTVIHTVDGFTEQRGAGAWIDTVAARFRGRLSDVLLTRTVGDLREAQRLKVGSAGLRVCIGDGIDLERFRPDEATRNPGEITVTCVARLDRGHDHATLLDAVRLLRRRGERLQIQIVGDGPGRLECRSLCRRWGIEDRVAFLGHRDDIPELLRSSDIFVYLSTQCRLSHAILEAMASGLPIVAYHTPTTEGVVTHLDNGILVEHGDADKLAAAISFLADHRQERRHIAEQARVTAETRFDEREVVRSLRSVYASIPRSSHQPARPQPQPTGV